jgi:hypothetical protein
MDAQVIFTMVSLGFHDQPGQAMTVISAHQAAAEKITRNIQCIALIEFSWNHRHGVILLD